MKRIVISIGLLTVLLLGVSIEEGNAVGILDRFLGKKKNTEGVKHEGLSVHRPFLDSLSKPTIRIEKSDADTLSKIGGLPTTSAAFKWPQWNGMPLAFLCQINLSEIPRTEAARRLPPEGMLYVFYDQEQRTWGFDPKDRGSWKILYINDSHDLNPVQAPPGLGKAFIYSEKFVRFSEVSTYPDGQDERIDKLDLDEEQFDDYFELCQSVFEGQPFHQLFGYAAPVQGNEMDLECQLASNGLYNGDASAHKDARFKDLEAGRREWMLLLQLDTDDDTQMMWGDAGRLYFWIRADDLEKKNFENVWMILQCY